MSEQHPPAQGVLRVDLGGGHYLRIAWHQPEPDLPSGSISIRSYNPNTKRLAMGPKFKVEAIPEVLGALSSIAISHLLGAGDGDAS